MDRLLTAPTKPEPGEWERCAADVVHWADTYLWTYDPRLLPADPFIRFRLFPVQADLFRWIEERMRRRESGLLEKSRGVGASYICIGFALHGWLFDSGFSAGFGSAKLELVDRLGDPDTLFEKLRILLYHLPTWQMPTGFDRSRHDNFARLVNPATGATITGQGGDQIGRGGRKSIYFIDESAFIEHADLLDRSLAETTNVRIDVSTPNGPGNAFWRRRHSGAVPVFTFHWRSDPRKTEVWAAQKRAEIGEVAWAQEYDIDYAASVEGICIPAKWVRAAINLALPRISSGFPLIAGFDVAARGASKSVVIARRGPAVLEPRSWSRCNTTESAWRAIDFCRAFGTEVLNFDAIGLGEGVRGVYESAERPLGVEANGIVWGQPATETEWPNGLTSREMFANLRAELWWILRVRCEKAYEYSLWLAGEEGGKEHPGDEMISLPADAELIAQLSLPLIRRTETGKIKIESKEDMAKRGVASPDYADALALTFAPRAAPWEIG